MSLSEGPVYKQVRVSLRVLLVADNQVPQYLGPAFTRTNVHRKVVFVRSCVVGAHNKTQTVIIAELYYNMLAVLTILSVVKQKL